MFDANSVSVGLSGKLEQIDSPSSVTDFIEDNFSKDFNWFILFNKHSWLACKGHSVTSYFLKFSTLRYSVLGSNT